MTVSLTEKQKQICDLISHGFMNKEIGHRLGLSDRTIEYHRKEIYRKTGAKSGVDVVLWMFSKKEELA